MIGRISDSPLHKLYLLINRKDKVRLIFLNFLMVLNSLLELLGVGAIPGLIILITKPARLQKIPLIGEKLIAFHNSNPKQLIIYVIVTLFILFLIKNLFTVFLNYKKGEFVRDIQVDLSNRLLKKYVNSPYEFHLSSNTAELLRNVNGEITQVVNMVIVQMLTLIMSVLVGLAILILLFVAEPVISAIAITVFGLVSFSFLRFTKTKIKYYGTMGVDMRKQKNKYVLQGLALVKEIKILDNAQYFLDKYDEALRKEAYITLHKSVMERVPRAMLEMVTIGLMLGIILFIISSGMDIDKMVALLALFAVSAMRLMPVTNDISTAITNIRYSMPSIDPLYKDITNVKEEEEGVPLSFGSFNEGVIEIKNLSFTYKSANKKVLNNLSFNIPIGSSVAFVGPSGAGKSTLVDLLLGILPIGKDHIFCNGVDISAGLKSWRSKIGYIPQQITLIDDSILNNICLGIKADKIQHDKVTEVLEQSQLIDFIKTLPEGLNTRIGDRGVKLSGGQRQRIGIARALYNNPSILVMDEATSSLDNITEKFVVEAIEQFKGKRTIIMIAHRLTTVQNCDIIFFLKDGKVISSGNYDFLINNNPEFIKMAQI